MGSTDSDALTPEFLADLREADYLDRDWEMLNRFTVEKYGMAPLSLAMPEAHACLHTQPLNRILGRPPRAHTMTLMRIDPDQHGRPRKWLAEKSHGNETGNKGRWTLLYKWFKEHVCTIIAHKHHIPTEHLKRCEVEATALPAWHPRAQGIRLKGDRPSIGIA